MAGKKALIVIDMQNDYLWDKRMKKFSYETEKLTAEVNKSIVEFAANGDDVIYIAQMFPNIITNKWFIGFSIKGTEGAELYTGMKKVSDLYFEKNLPDTFSSSKFKEYVKSQGYSELVLCGLDECGCVGATAKGAVKAGFSVSLIEKSTGCRYKSDKQNKMRETLKALGVKYI